MSIEESIRAKWPNSDDPMVELAAKIAQTLDAGDGNAALIRELKEVLLQLRTGGSWERRSPLPATHGLMSDEDYVALQREVDSEPFKGGTWINGEKVS